MASFEETLEQRLAVPREVGDVRLSYVGGMLLGQARSSGSRTIPQACLLGACGAGALGGLVVLFGGSAAAGLLLGAVAAALLFLAAVLEQRARSPRRFVLNFETETLRLDYAKLARPATELLSFTKVEGLRAGEGRRGGRLEVDYQGEGGAARTRLLVDEVRPDELESFEQLKSLLEGALAQRAKPVLSCTVRDPGPSRVAEVQGGRETRREDASRPLTDE
jgi:hypothetical protein